MTFMGVVLEKWPIKSQKLLTYMYNMRLATSRDIPLGWVSYDEQYRFRKVISPHLSWGIIEMDLWLLYVSIPSKSLNRTGHQSVVGNDAEASDQYTQKGQGPSSNKGFRSVRTCWSYNRGSTIQWSLGRDLWTPLKAPESLGKYLLSYRGSCSMVSLVVYYHGSRRIVVLLVPVKRG